MNFEEMSDFEINKLVAEKLLHDGNHWSTWLSNDPKLGTVWFVDQLNVNKAIYFDPCNNPSDAWPIIFENKICLNAYDNNEGWFATTDTSFFIDDDKPLRAAMICFLKVLQSNSK